MTHTVADRRTEILDAALACFLEQGYAATTISDIRKRSGASTGSIYHFFANKGALALALVERAISGWSVASPAVGEASAAEIAIKSSVSGLVRWGLANPAERRFIDELRSLASADPSFAQVARIFSDGATAAADRYALYLRRGEVRDLPWPLAHALMLGPAYDYLRLVASTTPPHDAAQLLADAAWNAVRAEQSRP